MMLELLKVGHCTHPEFVTLRGGSWRSRVFPAIVGLVRHPVFGPVLFDTGYARHFMAATQPFPERFYRWTTPVHLPHGEELLVQLHQRGIDPTEVRYVFISHFHADHVAGLKNFSAAGFFCSRLAWEALRQRSRWTNLIQGCLPDLLPSDFLTRARFIEDCRAVSLSGRLPLYDRAHDLLGDGSLLAVPLPGHARGHHGLLTFAGRQPLFLVGDACWSLDALEGDRPPHGITRLVMDDWSAYRDTLNRLGQLHGTTSDVALIPSHCLRAYEEYRGQSH